MGSCSYCGGELSGETPARATKVWCSTRCYDLEKAEQRRREGQYGLEAFGLGI